MFNNAAAQNISRRLWLRIAILAGIWIWLWLFVVLPRVEGIGWAWMAAWNTRGLLLAACILILMVLNWWLEVEKWHLLVGKKEGMKRLHSLQSVAAGLCLAMLTPSRIGDMAGKTAAWAGSKSRALSNGYIGGLGQLLVTLCAGLLALPFLVYYLEWPVWVFYSTLSGFLLVVVALPVYFGSVKLPFAQWMNNKGLVTTVTRTDRWQTLGLSFSRYLVFATQFVLALHLFGVGYNYLQLMMLVALVYLVMASIPAFVLGELGVRETISVWIIGGVTGNLEGPLLASLFVWFVNLAIPVMLAIPFLIRRNSLH